MSITTFQAPSAEQILAQLLSNYQAITIANGNTVGINPGSEIYTRFSAIAQQQAILYQIALQQIDARMPDTATGADLDRVLNQYGLIRKPATSSEGFVQLIAQAPQTLTAGMLLNGPNGLKYQVTTSGVYQPSTTATPVQASYVPVNCINQGSNTDLGVGQVLTWININSLMQSTTPVVIALTGGSDAETDEQARFRLYQTIQNPPNAGNSQSLINLASNIDPIVEAGFVYPDYNGAGTQLIALMGYQSDGYYIGRDIPHLLTDNQVAGTGSGAGTFSSPYNAWSLNYGTNLANDTSSIYGQLPAIIANQYASVVTTVNNYPTDYVFGFNLPYPIGNPVNGLGGGWINNYQQTWPVPSPATLNGNTAPVISVISATQIVVQAYSVTTGADSTYDPIPGLTCINWIDRSGANNNGWKVIQATVLAFSKALVDTHTFRYTLTLDTPLVCGITSAGQTDYYGNTMVAANDLIFPASVNAQNYINTIMGSYARLGPGQVVQSSSLLTQLGANRQPSAGSIYSPILSSQFLQDLTTNNQEIYNVQKLYNSTDSLTVPNNPPVSNPPTIFIPQNIAWYDLSRIQTS